MSDVLWDSLHAAWGGDCPAHGRVMFPHKDMADAYAAAHKDHQPASQRKLGHHKPPAKSRRT